MIVYSFNLINAKKVIQKLKVVPAIFSNCGLGVVLKNIKIGEDKKSNNYKIYNYIFFFFFFYRDKRINQL